VTRRRLAWVTYVIIILFLVLCVVWLRNILLPFVIALIIGYVLDPLITRGHGWGVPRWLGVMLVYAVLIGLVALFLRFLVPIINNESSKLLGKLNIVLQEAPRVYGKLESGVGEVLDRMAGHDERPVSRAGGQVVVRDEDWGFGPPVHKIPSVAPPAISSLEFLTFGSGEDDMSETGLPEQPRLSSVRFKEGKPQMVTSERPSSSLVISQVEPGVFGVDLGRATVEVRKVGEATFTVAAKDEPYE